MINLNIGTYNRVFPVFLHTYEDGLEIWRSRKSLALSHLNWQTSWRQSLLTPEGINFFNANPNLAIRILTEIKGLFENDSLSFSKPAPPLWSLVKETSRAFVFKREEAGTRIAIKVLKSLYIEDTVSTAVQTQILRLLSREGIDTVDVYACSPFVMVMEYVEAPTAKEVLIKALVDGRDEEADRISEEVQKGLKLAREKYIALSKIFVLPEYADIQDYNCFLIKSNDQSIRLKFFDIGCDVGFSKMPRIQDHSIISRLEREGFVLRPAWAGASELARPTSFQTIPLIIPNTIHGCKKKDLGRM